MQTEKITCPWKIHVNFNYNITFDNSLIKVKTVCDIYPGKCYFGGKGNNRVHFLMSIHICWILNKMCWNLVYILFFFCRYTKRCLSSKEAGWFLRTIYMQALWRVRPGRGGDQARLCARVQCKHWECNIHRIDLHWLYTIAPSWEHEELLSDYYKIVSQIYNFHFNSGWFYVFLNLLFWILTFFFINSWKKLWDLIWKFK